MDISSNHDEESRFIERPDCPSIKYWEHDVWINGPLSVSERRKKFLRWMGGENLVDTFDIDNGDLLIGDTVMENCVAMPRASSIEEEFMSCSSSWSSSDTDDSCLRQALFNVDEKESLAQLQKVDGEEPKPLNKSKRNWLDKLLSKACMKSTDLKDDDAELKGCSQVQETVMQRVRVNHCRKRLKEFSALFSGQDIQAHAGSIQTMKFSHDGQYLASAGEDKIVRVWQVVEFQRSDPIGIPEADPSHAYISANHQSENLKKPKSLIRTKGLGSIIFPSKVFRILEEPLHVFRGHSGDILDLSWSKNNFLLSSSDDKTVRLWRVGSHQCLRVFRHSDYVTCVQFNPVNEDYFISGSIDGKVRIWGIGNPKVVDWAETRDIVTAVSYCPDGQGGIIGSMSGTCRFFNTSDNHFQLGTEVCLSSKKSSCKRIVGFQFWPQDPSKVLVTCADLQARILDGTNVIQKNRGLQNDGCPISASFTSDRKHIVAVSENSNVYIWNYADQGRTSSLKTKTIRSFEYFSSDAYVAIPWPGIKTRDSENDSELSKHHRQSISLSSYSPYVSQGKQYSSILRSKVSATWPEERLPVYRPEAAAPAWGLVIVTGGRDGRIRSFHNYGLPVWVNTIQSIQSRIDPSCYAGM